MCEASMQRTTPLRVFQPSVNQRLSSRKITCKAFLFVVEEQRVTSYPQRIVDLLPNFSFTCGWTRRICTCLPEDFPPLYAGVTCLSLGNGWLRAQRIRARLWNKKVNLLAVCFAGYECFQSRLFMARALCGS